MMPVIRISDASFEALKNISKWLEIETPSAAIEQLVHERMDQLGLEHDTGSNTELSKPDEVMQFVRAPGLHFTRVLRGSINGKELTRTNWGGILLSVIRCLKEKGLSPEELVDELAIRSRVGQFEEHGFKFFKDLGISFQGQSAPDAWKETNRIAEKWNIPVSVEFQWRDNPKAQHPGCRGKIQTQGR